MTVKTAAAVVPPEVVTVTLRAPKVSGGGDGQRGGDLGGAHHGDIADLISAESRHSRRRRQEVRAGEGDGDRGALDAARGCDGGEGRSRAALTVKTTAAVVPAEVVTVTLRAPVVAVAAIVKVAVIWVALTTMTLLTVTAVEETVTVAPETKFVPVRVTGTVVALGAARRSDRGEGRRGGVDGEDDGGGRSGGGGDGDVARRRWSRWRKSSTWR